MWVKRRPLHTLYFRIKFISFSSLLLSYRNHWTFLCHFGLDNVDYEFFVTPFDWEFAIVFTDLTTNTHLQGLVLIGWLSEILQDDVSQMKSTLRNAWKALQIVLFD